MKQSALRDLLVGTVIITDKEEKGTLRMLRPIQQPNGSSIMSWLIDFEVRGLKWVHCDEVQKYELV